MQRDAKYTSTAPTNTIPTNTIPDTTSHTHTATTATVPPAIHRSTPITATTLSQSQLQSQDTSHNASEAPLNHTHSQAHKQAHRYNMSSEADTSPVDSGRLRADSGGSVGDSVGGGSVGSSSTHDHTGKPKLKKGVFGRITSKLSKPFKSKGGSSRDGGSEGGGEGGGSGGFSIYGVTLGVDFPVESCLLATEPESIRRAANYALHCSVDVSVGGGVAGSSDEGVGEQKSADAGAVTRVAVGDRGGAVVAGAGGGAGSRSKARARKPIAEVGGRVQHD